MALIVETGAGLSTAESYLSVAEALTYHNNLGNTAWAALTVTQQEQALRRATNYMIGEYRLRWLGRRVFTTQSLDWPRVGVVIEDLNSGSGMQTYGLFQVLFTIVPPEVKNACAELALRASIAVLLDDQSQKVVQEVIGPIRVTYDKDSAARIVYPQVDAMLRVFLKAGGNAAMGKMIRC